MQRFHSGDRVRIDLSARGSTHPEYEKFHGRHATVTGPGGEIEGNAGAAGQGTHLRVTFDDGATRELARSTLRPVPNVTPTLSEREYDTVTNIWGDDVPKNLRDAATTQLWAMNERVSDAVQLCDDDDDMESKGILLPIALKINHVLSERVSR